MKSLFEQFNEMLYSENEDEFDEVEYESDVKILCEKEGRKLVFVSTPRHGYFGYVYKNGRLVMIGEEDEGIMDEKVKEYFNVNEYGNLDLKEN